jgi:uncharacterized protein YraI
MESRVLNAGADLNVSGISALGHIVLAMDLKWWLESRYLQRTCTNEQTLVSQTRNIFGMGSNVPLVMEVEIAPVVAVTAISSTLTAHPTAAESW